MEPITVRYAQGEADWTIEATGSGQTLTATAGGIIAGRDVADQLVQRIAPAEQHAPTVVHLLNGSAVEFSRAYLAARLSLPVTATSTGTHHRASASSTADEPANSTDGKPEPNHETGTGNDADVTSNGAAIDELATVEATSSAVPSSMATNSEGTRREPRGGAVATDDQITKADPQTHPFQRDHRNRHPSRPDGQGTKSGSEAGF